MFGAAIIVFREVVEAALIVSIIMAACQGVPGRNRWIASGVFAGVSGAALVALFAASIAGLAAGIGQELMNATILFVAVVMLGCHNIWMARHGRKLAARVNAVGQAVAGGDRPLYALSIVVAAAVLREGSETVLFVYGVGVGGGDGVAALLAGCLIGLASGIALGAVLYFGLLRIPMRHLFNATNGLILLLAAGLAAQGAGFLSQADVLPSWGDAVWDTSAVLSEHSVLGKILHAPIGYVAEPTGIQLVFYLATLLGIGALMQWLGGRQRRGSTLAAIMAVAAAAVLGLSAAKADDLKVRHPIIEPGEFEVDHNSTITFDRPKSAKSNNQTHATELEYGVFDWWKPGFEVVTAAPSGENLHVDAFAFENYFQLTPQGKYWADLTLFAEVEHPVGRGDPRAFTFGPLIQKEVPNLIFGLDTVHTLNVLYEKKWGPSNGDLSTMHLVWQSCVLVHVNINPCVEYFGDLNLAGQGEGPRHRLGPGIAGKLPFRSFFGLDLPGGLKYETAYVFGLNDRTQRGAIQARVEVELYAIRF